MIDPQLLPLSLPILCAWRRRSQRPTTLRVSPVARIRHSRPETAGNRPPARISHRLGAPGTVGVTTACGVLPADADDEGPVPATFVAVERFEARREVFLAWSALEEAAGVPLLQWPDATTPAPAGDAPAPDAAEVK